MTTDQKRTAKNPRLVTVGIGSSGRLSTLGSEQLTEHVEGRRLGHAALLPAIDRALADAAEIAELACCQAKFGARCLNAGRVVHNQSVIAEDDGLAVGARGMVDCDAHGSEAADHTRHNGIADDDLADQLASHHAISADLDQIQPATGLAITTGRNLSIKSAGALQPLVGRLVAAPHIGAVKRLANCGSLILHSVSNRVGYHAANSAHNCAVSKRKLRKSAQCFVSRWSAQRCAVRFFKDNTTMSNGSAAKNPQS